MKRQKFRTRNIKFLVKKQYLFLLSGLMWSLVGLLLCRLAVTWLLKAEQTQTVLFSLCGICAALLITRFGFSKIALKNIKRIDSLPQKTSIFAFQSVKSYLIILAMITLGISLRHSSLPKPYLAVLYIGIGLALFLSSLRYYQSFFKKK